MTQSEISLATHRPQGGWIKSMRGSRGMSLQAVADRMKISPQAVHQFEHSEVNGTISLRQLGSVAAAMGCRLTYALLAPQAASVTLPKSRSAPKPVTPRATTPTAPLEPSPAESAERTVEHSMFLRNQADGRFD
jgi:transcriptional regulator with XRE-family HTH domain